MIKTCLKCRFTNPDASDDSHAECPKCGAVYAKTDTTMAQLRHLDSVRERVKSRREPSTNPSTLERIGWYMTMAGSVLGLIQLFYTWSNAESAPQQAAGAAMAIAVAAIPYCLARAIQLVSR